MKVKKNDMVEVISGKDKGARGKVIAAYPRTNQVLVEGVNRVTKHTKVQTSRRGSKTGGIVHQEAPIHVSNVMVLDEDGTKTRVGYRIDPETGAKVRFAKKTGKELS
jgi:large subunit ribosomal protein L24